MAQSKTVVIPPLMQSSSKEYENGLMMDMEMMDKKNKDKKNSSTTIEYVDFLVCCAWL